MAIYNKLQRKYNKLKRNLSQTKFGNTIIPIPPPRSFYIELTSRCNLSCTMCALHSKNAKALPDRRAIGDMEFGLFQKIAEEVASISPQPELRLNYAGESLLYPRFRDVLSLMSKMGLSGKCHLSTNGTLLSREIADMLLKLYEGNINISLDGFKESHEQIRLGSNYDKVNSNLMYLIERRKNLGVSRPNISVNLTRVSQPESEIQEFVDYWVPKVDKVGVMAQLTRDSQIVRSHKFIEDLLSTKKKMCLEPFSSIGILWDGSIVLCCNDIPGLGGNIKANVKNETLMNIWRGPEFKRIRQKMIAGDVSDIPACRKCEVWVAQYIMEEITMDKYKATQVGVGVKYKSLSAKKNK